MRGVQVPAAEVPQGVPPRPLLPRRPAEDVPERAPPLRREQHHQDPQAGPAGSQAGGDAVGRVRVKHACTVPRPRLLLVHPTPPLPAAPGDRGAPACQCADRRVPGPSLGLRLTFSLSSPTRTAARERGPDPTIVPGHFRERGNYETIVNISTTL